jgi:hypothetical protein
VVLFRTDIPGSKTSLQGIKRAESSVSLKGYVIWNREYPKQQHDPNEPPDKVHPPEIIIVKHDFFFKIY